MIRLARTLGLVLTALGAAGVDAGQAQSATPDTERTAAARELIGLMRAGEVSLAALEAQVPAQRAAMPQVPLEFWTEFVSLAKRDLPKLIDAMDGHGAGPGSDEPDPASGHTRAATRRLTKAGAM